MQEKPKLTREHFNTLWDMRNLSVKEMIEAIKNNKELKFVLTSAGIWWCTKTIVFAVFIANLIYFILRVFSIVFS